MKKVVLIIISAAFIAGLAISAFAATTVTSTVTVNVTGVLSIEFDTDASGLSDPSAVNFTVDYSQTYANPDGHVGDDPNTPENEGKSDVGVRCKDNSGNTWYLKMNVSGGLAGDADAFSRYISTAYASNGDKINGAGVDNPNKWVKIPSSATTVYTSGQGTPNDDVSTPFGTLIGISLSLQNLNGIYKNMPSSTLTYTISES